MLSGGISILSRGTAPSLLRVKNNYVAQIRLSEESARNIIDGEILDGENIIYKVSGYAGQKAFFTDVTKDGAEEQLFVDISTYKDNTILQLPDEVQMEFDSLRLWHPVKEAIIRNDMVVADEEKKKIEADQRIRNKTRLSNGSWKDAQYFLFHSKKGEEELTEEEELERGVWEFKNNISVDLQYITSMQQEAEQIREKRAAEKAAQVPEPEPEPDEVTSDETDDTPDDGNDTCSVQ